MKQLLILLCTVIVFTNCNNKKGWSLAEQQDGMKKCMDQVVGKVDDATGKKYCSCVLEQAMKKYNTYADANNASDADGEKLAQSCLKVLTGNNNGGDDNNKGGGIFGGLDDNNNKGKKKLTDDDNEGGGGAGNGWSMTDKNNFLTPCSQTLTQKGYSNSQARQLCNCGLQKLEQLYSSLQDADARGGEKAGAKVMQECVQESQNEDNQ